jgi:hypothetical protein
MPQIEQIKLRRGTLGLRGHDRERAFQGFTLFATMFGDALYLIDMQGEVVHRWPAPYPPGLYGYLTERGTLFYNGKILEEPGRFVSQQPWKGGVVLEMDWNGRVLWELRHPDHHHDGIRLRDGNVMLLCITRLPEEVAARVQGGQPGTEHEGAIYADYLVELTSGGDVVWEWRSWEHLDPDQDRITAVQQPRYEWTHGNTVSEMANGNIVVSFRQISTVAIVERGSGAIVWKLGAPPLAHQHAPYELANGNLLIFDNGTHRLDHPLPYSRVIEVDIATKEIVWSYQEAYPIDFFSPHISNAQRLPNGNTLICEGAFGRLFEVTPEREVVWEYVNPFFFTEAYQPDLPPQNRVFRAYRYSPEEIERARTAGAAT